MNVLGEVELQKKAKNIDNKIVLELCTYPTKQNCKVSWCNNPDVCHRNNKAVLLNDVLPLIEKLEGRLAETKKLVDKLYSKWDFLKWQLEFENLTPFQRDQVTELYDLTKQLKGLVGEKQ